MDNKYLEETKLINYSSKNIQNIVKEWMNLSDYQKVQNAYNYV